VITDNGILAAQLRSRLGHERVSLHLAGAFDAEIEAGFAALADPVVDLPGGGRLHVYPTPALTAIDVDAGSVAGTRDRVAHLRLNAVAAAEIGRQIRLRNLAGAILVDFAGLSTRQREALAEPLGDALRADPLQPRLLGLSRLGLMEILRSRVHPPLHDVLGQPPSCLTHVLAALRRAAREAAATRGRPLRLRAAPEVLAALDLVPGALDDYRDLAGSGLVLRADGRLRPGEEQIEAETG
jgi:Rne/Rng family ribonuclease